MIKIGGVGLTGNQHPLMLLGGILIFCLLFVPFAAAQEDTGIAPLNKTQDLTEGNKTCVLSEGSVLVPDPADYADRLNYVPGEVIVEFEENPTVNSAEVSAINSGIDAEVVKTLKGPVLENTQLVKLPEDVSVDEAVSYYSNEPGVIYACPNYLYWLDEVPNDPYFDLQWGLYNNGQTGGTAGADIDALNAWNITKGSEGIVVAVIDSGVKYDHEDLMANIWTNEGEIPDNHIDDDGNGYIDDVHGWDFVNNDNDPMDDNNHGTHCSGIIGAVGNNDAGITGVNWNVKLMPLKAGNALGSLPYIAILEAMDYANSNGADIVSCSFGGDTYTSQQKSMIDASSALYICAAGNSGTDNDYYPHYPSNYDCDNIIAVAATDSDDELADYSCYGVRSVDVAAPGSYIYSTISTTVKFSDDFSSLNSWDAEDPWELTRSHWHSFPTSVTDSPDGYYSPNTNAKLTLSEPIDLSSASYASLSFYLTGIAETGYDYLYCEVSPDGTNWDSLIVVSGDYSDAWYKALLELSDYCGESSLFIRFRFYSDNMYNYDGYCIDDVEVTAVCEGESDYAYMSGTSMATPCVSGLAALLMAGNSSLTISEVKDTILNTVDDRDLPIATGGRINAYEALKSAVPEPAPEIPEAEFSADVTSGTAPLSVQFSDESTGNPTSWLWDFGDGDISAEQNPSHTYTETGTYDVSLTASNEAGSDTIGKTDYITVGESPQPELPEHSLYIGNTAVSIAYLINSPEDATELVNQLVTNQGLSMADLWYRLYDGDVVNILTGDTATEEEEEAIQAELVTYIDENGDVHEIISKQHATGRIVVGAMTFNDLYVDEVAEIPGATHFTVEGGSLQEIGGDEPVTFMGTGSVTLLITDSIGNTLATGTLDIPEGVGEKTFTVNLVKVSPVAKGVIAVGSMNFNDLLISEVNGVPGATQFSVTEIEIFQLIGGENYITFMKAGSTTLQIYDDAGTELATGTLTIPVEFGEHSVEVELD